MTHQEYKDAFSAIESDYQKAKKELYLKYGFSKAKYGKGDIIGCEYGIIQIQKITIHVWDNDPLPVYSGIELKKDLTPRKHPKNISIRHTQPITLYRKAEAGK